MPPETADGERPLTGVRVLEVTTAWAGPMAARILATLGADVIKVESPAVLDVWRGPVTNGDPSRYPDREPGDRPYDRSVWFNTQNHGKRSLATDLKAPGAGAVLDRLVPTIDVVLCNYAAGVLDRLGLDHDTLVERQPRIVSVVMPVAGAGGPLSDTPGVGPTMEALAGMTALIGYGDGVPTPTGPAYLDPIGALNAALAVLLALRARDETGQPQSVELAQREAALHWIGEWLLAVADSGGWAEPTGNAVAWAAPHDAYRALGDDEWVVVAVETDEQWRRLCEVIGREDLAVDGHFATTQARLGHRSEVDEVVGAWTAGRAKDEAATLLQGAGVPAAPVQSGADVHDDPHLVATGFVLEVEHPAAGRHRYQGLPFHFDRTPTEYGEPAPCFGQHTIEILDEIGFTAAEIDALVRSGVVTTGLPLQAPAGVKWGTGGEDA